MKRVHWLVLHLTIVAAFGAGFYWNQWLRNPTVTMHVTCLKPYGLVRPPKMVTAEWITRVTTL